MIKKSRTNGTILDVNIVSTSTSKVLAQVRSNITKKQKFYIVTPNPEIVLLAQKDNELKRIINDATISIPDGIGLSAARYFNQLPVPKHLASRLIITKLQGMRVGTYVLFKQNVLRKELEIIKGRELFMDLIKLANQKKWRVYLLGGKNGVAKKTKESLTKNYKSVKIKVGDGPTLNVDGTPASKDDLKVQSQIVNDINKFKPHLLFVAFGAPKQEKWISANLKKLNIGGAMVVGGTFDYVSGNVALPPKIMGKNFEWLWRLVTQPKRIKRIFNAMIVFPCKVYSNKISRR